MRLGVLTLVGLLAAVAGPAAAAAEIVPVPRPVVDNLEAVAREQLAEQRATLDRLLAEEGPPAEQADAFGQMGRLYYLYDLSEPAEACFMNASGLDPDRFDWPYFLGVIHRKEGRLEEARVWLERGLALAPEDRPGLLRLAEVEVEAGGLDRAEELYRRVLAGDADSAAAWYGLGRVAYERGEHETAVERFHRVLDLQPEANSTHHLLGLAYRQLGDLDRARHHLGLNRHGVVAFPDPLLDGLVDLVRSAQFYLKAANRAVERGRLGVALQMLEHAAGIDPDDPLVRYNLGLVLVRLGEAGRAEEQFRLAVAANPDYRNAHYNLASLLAERGRLDEAVTHLERTVEIDPEDLEARRRLIDSLIEVDRLADAAAALSDLEESGLAEPADVRTGHLRLASLLGQRGLFTAAAAEFEAAVGLDPQDEQASFGLAMALILGEDYRRARGELEQALTRLPRSLPLAHVLARLLATCPDDAVRDGPRALDLARQVFQAAQTPDHAETVAMALAETGDFAGAARWQREVLTRAEQAGVEEVAARARRRLAGYEQGRPSRAPWREPS